MRVCSYKLNVDSGFAPNPFFGQLTLATCKPGIRRTKKIGDWIAGFTSKRLAGDEVNGEKLIFLMEVTDVIEQSAYYAKKAFKRKIPDFAAVRRIERMGDNIYRPLRQPARGPDDFEQIRNPNHGSRHKKRDLSGNRVLVSENFYYFGRRAPEIPDEIRPRIPRGQTGYGVWTKGERAEALVDRVQRNFRQGVLDRPHMWRKSDDSWNIG